MAKQNPLSQGLNQARRPEPVAVVLPAAAKTAPTAAKKAVSRIAPSREGRVLVGGHFAPEVQTALKILAAKERSSVQTLLAEGIDAVFARRHEPQIASLTAIRDEARPQA